MTNESNAAAFQAEQDRRRVVTLRLLCGGLHELSVPKPPAGDVVLKWCRYENLDLGQSETRITSGYRPGADAYIETGSGTESITMRPIAFMVPKCRKGTPVEVQEEAVRTAARLNGNGVTSPDVEERRQHDDAQRACDELATMGETTPSLERTIHGQ